MLPLATHAVAKPEEAAAQQLPPIRHRWTVSDHALDSTWQHEPEAEELQKETPPTRKRILTHHEDQNQNHDDPDGTHRHRVRSHVNKNGQHHVESPAVNPYILARREPDECMFCPDGLPDVDALIPTNDDVTCGQAQDISASLGADDATCTTLLLAQVVCCPAAVAIGTGPTDAGSDPTEPVGEGVAEPTTGTDPTELTIEETTVPVGTDSTEPVDEEITEPIGTTDPTELVVGETTIGTNPTESAGEEITEPTRTNPTEPVEIPGTGDDDNVPELPIPTTVTAPVSGPSDPVEDEASTGGSHASKGSKTKGSKAKSSGKSSKGGKVSGKSSKDKMHTDPMAKVHKDPAIDDVSKGAPVASEPSTKGGTNVATANKGEAVIHKSNSHLKSNKGKATHDGSKSSKTPKHAKAHKFETIDTKAKKVFSSDVQKSKASKKTQTSATADATAVPETDPSSVAGE